MALLMHTSPAELTMAHSLTTVLSESLPEIPHNIKPESTNDLVCSELSDHKILVILASSTDPILRIVSEVTGRPLKTVDSLSHINDREQGIIGIPLPAASQTLKSRSNDLIVINTRNIQDDKAPVAVEVDVYDYEFLYIDSPFLRRDLVRFLSHILGQTKFHEKLLEKERSNLISTTFPDVRVAIPNLDILTVGADAVELRVDLLEEPLGNGTFGAIPSLDYVGEQVMLLRQRSEVPLIFTTRCTKENGRFPMDDPELFYKYLSRAIQWAVEYIDVELWLPEDLRMKLKAQKGNSKIISAFHDFSGELRWNSDEAFQLFEKAKDFGDIVKMNKHIKSRDENHELELFRSRVREQYPHPPLSAVNMGQLGQWSRALNRIFSPVTHPLLPIIAAPGQLSAAEINEALHYMGNLSKREYFSVGPKRSTAQIAFFKKCFNELGLTHNLSSIWQGPRSSIEALLSQPAFGGALLQTPISSAQAYLPVVSEAARHIRQVDTIVARGEGDHRQLIGVNITWKAISAALTRDFLPSAYIGRTALILAQSAAEAAPAMYALRSLGVSLIYTVGFKASTNFATHSERFVSVESMKRSRAPFVIISALAKEKSFLSHPLLKHYGSQNNSSSKVFLDIVSNSRNETHLKIAMQCGWTVYDANDVGAWTIVETLRSLVGHNVSFDFVRMASDWGTE